MYALALETKNIILMKKIYPLLYFVFCCGMISAQNEKIDKLKEWLSQDNRKIEDFRFADKPLTKEEAETAAKLIYSKRLEDIKRTYQQSWDEKKFVANRYEMKFEYNIHGAKPQDGRSLYISLHGGGSTPEEVNDQQWKNQINLYKPAEGIYLSPRAAVNDWDMWFKPHVDALYEMIIQSAVAIMDVNPNKVYVMGYSAGGDGVYRIGTRMADHWAAASMMAGHPGNVSPLSLRNTGFSIWMGINDRAYNRNSEAARFGGLLDSLSRENPTAYKHSVHIVADKGHWMDRVDTAAMHWMREFVRNPYPEKIAWRQDDVIRDKFYWLSVMKNEALPGMEVIVACKDNTINIIKNDYPTIYISLNDHLIDYSKPVKVMYQGKLLAKVKPSRSIGNIYKSVNDANIGSVYTSCLTIKRNKTVKKR